MERNIGDIEPKALWQHFMNIASIPHPSKSEQALKGYITGVAQRCGAEVREDQGGNLIIKMGATKGMESLRGVILQAHLDMVPQKSEERAEFDFLADSIEPYIDGEWVRANGTTLGADNGIGVAAALAILEGAESTPHGALEILLTVNEEMGMDGAFALQAGDLEGEVLLNLDTEEDGELCIGCAGGLSLTAKFEFEREQAPESGYVARRLRISGLVGGHSGIQIGEQRANANKLLFRFLRLTKLDIELVEISGGTLNNAIPREAYADILINIEELELLQEQLQRYEALIRSEYAAVESGIEATLTEIDYPQTIIEESAASCIVWAIAASHDGVYRNSYTLPDLVETSANLAIVRSDGDECQVEFLIRSFTEGGKVELADTIASTFELADAEVSSGDGYPSWQPNPSSQILGVMQQLHTELFGTEPSVIAVHAGLECGVIGATYPELDMISFGPTITSPHSPAEAVHIPSVERFYKLLQETLKLIPKRS